MGCLTVHNSGVAVHDIALVAAEQKTPLLVFRLLTVIGPVSDSTAQDQALLLVVGLLCEIVSGVGLADVGSVRASRLIKRLLVLPLVAKVPLRAILILCRVLLGEVLKGRT